MFKCPYWAKQGLLYLLQLFDECSNTKSYTQLQTEYGNRGLTCMEYNSLISAIPKRWKSTLKQSIDPQPVKHLYEIISDSKTKVKTAYNMLLHKNFSILNELCKKMQKRFNNFNLDKYKGAFESIYVITKVTKYRNFQYKVLQDCIYVNDRLYYWKKVKTQKCDYCECKQTIMHLFFRMP